MSDPVILLGTQSNGETLPVQVDAFGRLVAEGLEGQKGDKGDPGDQGIPGMPGPPGEDGQDGVGLPPWDGVPDGYILTIDSGEPTWKQNSAIPDPVWSELCTPGGGQWYRPETMPEAGFDGNLGTSVFDTANVGWNLAMPYDVEIQTFEVYSTYGNNFEYNYSAGNMSGSFSMKADAWNYLSRLSGVSLSAGQQIQLRSPQNAQCSFTALKLNGEILIDPAARRRKEIREAVQSVLSGLTSTSDIDLS